ncbi:hypothetical protein Tco_1419818, partial [Tanacetum coccineum]
MIAWLLCLANTAMRKSVSDVEEDIKSSKEFLAGLNSEFQDEGVTRFKAFMAIDEDEIIVGKTDARS